MSHLKAKKFQNSKVLTELTNIWLRQPEIAKDSLREQEIARNRLYMLLVLCYLFSVISSLLFVLGYIVYVTCSLIIVLSYLLYFIFYLLSAFWYALLAICCFLSVAFYLLLSFCYLLSNVFLWKLVITRKKLFPFAPVVRLVIFCIRSGQIFYQAIFPSIS